MCYFVALIDQRWERKACLFLNYQKGIYIPKREILKFTLNTSIYIRVFTPPSMLLVFNLLNRSERATMSRGSSYGGGQSSLGYLFGSDEQTPPPPTPRTANPPPYGIDPITTNTPARAVDTITEKNQDSLPPSDDRKPSISNNYHRAQGQNSGNFITVSDFLPSNCVLPLVHVHLLLILEKLFAGASIDTRQISSWRGFVSWVLIWR